MRFIFLRPSLFCALRLGPRRGLCALSAPSAFNHYGTDYLNPLEQVILSYLSETHINEKKKAFA
ncbi:hypothetical protein Hanom_Chr08g00758991 [Helianthus anomalus]